MTEKPEMEQEKPKTIAEFHKRTKEKLVAIDRYWAGTYDDGLDVHLYTALGLKFGLGEFKLTPESITITCGRETVEFDRWKASMALLAFQDGVDTIEYFERREMLLDHATYDFDFSTLKVSKKREGQAKVFLAFVETLPELEINEDLGILCIGSSGDIGISGLSYEALLDVLATCGHKGRMFMYDPNYERSFEYQYKTFRVSVHSAAYDYDRPPDLGDIDMIFEDVYVGTMASAPPRRVQSYVVPAKRGAVPLGQGLFVMYLDSEGKQRLRAWKGSRNDHHTSHGVKIAETAVLGGGRYMRNGSGIVVFGSSLHYGHYDKHAVEMALAQFGVTFHSAKHGREAFDPRWKLFDKYPKARISTKYFGESVPARVGQWRVRDQVAYVGKEQRLLINVPEYNAHASVCCPAHTRLAGVAAHMLARPGVLTMNVLDSAYAKVTRNYCVPYVGVTARAVRHRIQAAAVKSMYVSDTVACISASLRCDPAVVHRHIMGLVRYGSLKIRFSVSPVYPSHCKMPELAEIHGQKRVVYWTADYKHYYDLESNAIFTSDHRLVQAPSGKRPYLVRDNGPVTSHTYCTNDIVQILADNSVSYAEIRPHGIRSEGRGVVTVDMTGGEYVFVQSMPTTKMFRRAHKKLRSGTGYSIWSRK